MVESTRDARAPSGMCVVRRPPGVVAGGLIALILSGCGGLGQPVGDVKGRIIGATSAGHAYPVGRPDLAVPLVVGADDVGTYSIPNVPNTVPAIVLYDGAPPPGVSAVDGRAELVPIHVNGGEINVIADRYGAKAVLPAAQEGLRMPRAGTVLAAVVPEGGATPWRPTFNLPQTVHANLVPDTGGVYSVWPLPAGRFDVGALLAGFKGGATTVNVVSGSTMTAPVTLPIDDGAVAPGCGAISGAPSQCENGLVCEPLDGRCYECTAGDATHCSSGCSSETRTCNAPAPAVSTWCSPCTASTDCASATVSGMYCRVPDGSTTGTCTKLCTYDSDCPAAGFKCADGRCSAPEGCAGWVQTMGAVCYSDYRCAFYLARGWCYGDSDDHPGNCTAPCAVDSECHVATGATSTFACVGGHCAAP
jgi:hypothetical protein